MKKFFSILMIFILMFVPTEFFLIIKYILEPVGFWQNLILYGIGVYFLFTIQIVCLLFGLFGLCVIKSKERTRRI
jgi:hypothetical protein